MGIGADTGGGIARGLGTSVLINCILAGNSCNYRGGAAVGCTLINCTITGNSGELDTCDGCLLKNCISYYNSSGTVDGTSDSSSYSNCCVTAMPAFNSGNNFTNSPLFANLAAGDFHLGPASPCINAGNNAFVTVSTDLGGNPRVVAGVVDIGAYEFQAPVHYVMITGTSPVPAYTNWATAATNIQGAIDAASPGDFIVVSNGVYQSGGRTVNGYALTNRVAIDQPVTVESVNGPASTAIQGNSPPGNNAVRCVYLTNNATLIGFTLTNGASLTSGDETNEQSGGGIFCESTNCLLVNCLVISNRANWYGGGEYLGTSSNCTLTRNSAYVGGGAILGILSNCTLSNNFAGNHGGGTALCTLNNCTLFHNMVFGLPPLPRNFGYGGGAYGGNLDNCLILSNSAGLYGGGAYGDSTNPIVLNNCMVENNSSGAGGGVSGSPSGFPDFTNCVLTNCLFAFNSANNLGGGGAYQSTIVNCTITENTVGGGILDCQAYNSILYYNTNGDYSPDTSQYPLNYCCTPLMATNGALNITNAPLFANPAGNDFHLQSNSPCINSGNNIYVATATDLDGNPRIVGGTVDMGAYEYQSPVSMTSYQWLEQYGLPITNGIDTSSPNGTSFDVYQDWIAGLNPTNPASVLAMQIPVATNNANGLTVSWQSVNGISYLLQRATNLVGQTPFTTIQNNITGHSNTTSYTDTSATNNVPYFYRVGAQ